MANYLMLGATFAWREIFRVTVFLAIIHILLFSFRRVLPESKHYRHDVEQLKFLEALRGRDSQRSLKELRNFISVKGLTTPLFNNKSAEYLCIEILSVARSGRYLTQVVTALLARMPLKYQNRIRITLHNMNIPLDGNEEAISFGDLLHVKNVEYPPNRNPSKYEGHDNFIKETIDYLVAMDHVLESNCKYGLLLEDDAMASVGWADDLMGTLDELEAKNSRWMVLKLFSTFLWVDWNWRVPSDVITILCLTIGSVGLILVVLSTFAYFCDMISARYNYRPINELHSPQKPRFRRRLSWVSCIYLGIGVGIFYILLGKYTLFPYENGVHDRHMGASCVANVYPREELRLFRDYIQKEFGYYEKQGRLGELPKKDLHFEKMLDDLERTNGWRYQELFRLPNLFQHIGRKTSLDKESSWESMVISNYFHDDKTPIKFDKDVLQS